MSRPVYLGPHRLAMIAPVLAGEPVDAVAARLGVSRATIRNAVYNARRAAGTVDPTALAAWVAARAARPSAVEAAVRAAVAAGARRHQVPSHQVFGPGRTAALSAVRAEAIRAGKAAGGRVAEIARVLGLTHSAVRYVLAGGKMARAAA